MFDKCVSTIITCKTNILIIENTKNTKFGGKRQKKITDGVLRGTSNGREVLNWLILFASSVIKGTFINMYILDSEFTLLRTRETWIYLNFPCPGCQNRIDFFLISHCWHVLHLIEKFSRSYERTGVLRAPLIWTFLQHPACIFPYMRWAADRGWGVQARLTGGWRSGGGEGGIRRRRLTSAWKTVIFRQHYDIRMIFP